MMILGRPGGGGGDRSGGGGDIAFDCDSPPSHCQTHFEALSAPDACCGCDDDTCNDDDTCCPPECHTVPDECKGVVACAGVCDGGASFMGYSCNAAADCCGFAAVADCVMTCDLALTECVMRTAGGGR